MAGGHFEPGTNYSRVVGLIYVFNLIVGTGALAMPNAFFNAGWLLSVIAITLLAFVSYITVTFVTEAMGYANARLRLHGPSKAQLNTEESEKEADKETSSSLAEDQMAWRETEPLLNYSTDLGGLSSACDITHKVELGQMAHMFFNKIGVILFYLSMVLYLYGDLAIYAVAVPKSLRDVMCTYKPVAVNNSSCHNLTNNDVCWGSKDINRWQAYRICVAIFLFLLGPFVFFNVQKTKYLQMITTTTRWVAFSIMIVLCVIQLSKGHHQGRPKVADLSGVPNLFGVCVYSFMCHHSLPSLVTPIKNKKGLYSLLLADFGLILAFYSLLCFTGIFTFQVPNEIYTLNFLPHGCGDEESLVTNVKVIQYFLALFPVFTLSTNFPIISITLRNNLQAMFHRPHKPWPWFMDKIVFPLAAIIPPFLIAFLTDGVETLVGVTGSYAGAGIQYVIPTSLVLMARRQMKEQYGGLINPHASPFQHKFWIYGAYLWTLICVSLVTVNHIISSVK